MTARSYRRLPMHEYLAAVKEHRDLTLAVLVERGIHPKVVWAKQEKAIVRGYVSYLRTPRGTVRAGFLLPAGEDALARLRPRVRFSINGSAVHGLRHVVFTTSESALADAAALAAPRPLTLTFHHVEPSAEDRWQRAVRDDIIAWIRGVTPAPADTPIYDLLRAQAAIHARIESRAAYFTGGRAHSRQPTDIHSIQGQAAYDAYRATRRDAAITDLTSTTALLERHSHHPLTIRPEPTALPESTGSRAKAAEWSQRPRVRPVPFHPSHPLRPSQRRG